MNRRVRLFVVAIIGIVWFTTIVGCDEMNMVDEVVDMVDGENGEKPPPKPEHTPPAEITYYRDVELTRPVTDSVELGTVLYIQVVFSEEVPVVIADGKEARPSIFLTVRPDPENASRQTTRTVQYRMKPPGTDLQSGDAVPYQGAFLCKYVVGTEDFGKNFLTHTKVSEGGELEVMLLSAEAWRLWGKHEPLVQQSPNDFVGFVCAAYEYAVADVTVTIMAGPHAGKRVTTDQNGQYTFRDVTENELHLRVEKEHFEPKEVIVYRDRQTILANGDKPNFLRRPKTPGRIQIGQRWPDEIRPILENTLVVYDLLYYTDPTPREDTAGSYTESFGVIQINVKLLRRFSADPAGALLETLAHEVAHAHQHALLSVDGSIIDKSGLWENTPEGQAFAEAREKDWEEFGKIEPYDTHPHFLWLNENAAEVCVYYWIVYPQAQRNRQRLEVVAPNRFKWAEEWLGKK